MFRSLSQIYALSVCFVSSLIIMICIGWMLNSLSHIYLYNYTNGNELIHYANDNSYLKYQKILHTNEALNEEIIIKNRISDLEMAIYAIKIGAISTLINSIIWLCTGLLFFIIHWKLYKNLNNANCE